MLVRRHAAIVFALGEQHSRRRAGMLRADLGAIGKGRMAEQAKGQPVRRTPKPDGLREVDAVAGLYDVLAGLGDIFLIVGGKRHAGFSPDGIAVAVDLYDRE